MQSIRPRPEQSSPSAPEGARMFSWERCPVHGWLGVSVLVVGDAPPVCFREDGSAHPVDAADLKVAA